MDPRPLPKSALPRRGPNLPPIHTDVSHPLLDRPRLEKSRSQRLQLPKTYNTQSERGSQHSEPVKRQTSKTNLKSLFSRNKPAHQSNHHDSSLPVLAERRGSTPDYAYLSDTPRSLKSPNSTPTMVASSGLPTPTVVNGMSKIPSKPAKQRSVHLATTPWTPPPLFQAYPQAVKHACLSAPNLSADSILRSHVLKRNDSQRGPSHLQKPAAADAAQKKRERRDKAHARKISGSISKTLWTNKIYILDTSGYLLQYAGEGAFDRLPEKIMRLGPSSAAFATDAIPGKPWVLQISQKSSDDGKLPTQSPRGILSRFGIQSADSRRLAQTFFLVLSNPDEMTSWLVSLRTTIESLGGKKFVPEAAAKDNDVSSPSYNESLVSTNGPQSGSNLRKSSLTDIGEISGSIQSSRRSPVSSGHRQSSYQNMSGSASDLANAMDRRSAAGRTPPATAPLSSNGPTLRETDLAYENPRAPPRPPRSSSKSSELSSPFPSPSLSPRSPPGSLNFHRERPPASTNNRRSMYAYPSTQSDRKSWQPQVDVRPLSVIGNTTSLQSNSPPPPNFSVPSFSNKRYAVPRRGSRPSLASQDSNPTLSTASSLESLSTRGSETPRNLLSPKRDPGAGSNMNPTKRQSLVQDPSFLRDPRPSQPGQWDPSASFNTTSRPPNFSSDTSADSPKSSIYSMRYPHSVRSPDAPLRPQAKMANFALQQRSGIPTQQSRLSVMLPKPTSGSLSTSAPGNHEPLSPPRNIPTVRPPRDPKTQSRPSANPSKPKSDGHVHGVQPAKTSFWARTRQQQSSIPSSLPQPHQVSPRKSMPSLPLGPPVAPPPNCPLPEVPLNIASQHSSVWPVQPSSSRVTSPDLRRRSADVRQLALAGKQRMAAPAPASRPEYQGPNEF